MAGNKKTRLSLYYLTLQFQIAQLRRAVDIETARYTRLEEFVKAGSCSNNDDSKMAEGQLTLYKSEERLQALSVVMLYLCTGLQYIQAMTTQ